MTFKVKMSIACPFCEHEEDEVTVTVFEGGRFETYICPKCNEIVIGENDQEIADELVKNGVRV